MTRMLWLVPVVAATLTACQQPTPEQQLINDAAAAMGGREQIQAVRTLDIKGEGMAVSVGSDRLIDTMYRTYDVTGYRRALDLEARRMRLEQTRTPKTANYSGQRPVPQVQGLDGQVAFNVSQTGSATRVSDPVATNARRAQFYHHPLTIVRAALDPASAVTNLRVVGSEQVVDLVTADGISLTLAIASANKLPSRVVSTSASDNILGDAAIETSFGDYQDVDGLQLPAQLNTKVDRFKDADLRLTSQMVDTDLGVLAAPASVAAAAPTEEPARSTVTVTEVAPHVWLLGGTTHHSVLVEFSDHLTLIEAPNEDRAIGVIAKARELRPNKPLTTLVNTHHHFDHSGGIRTAVAEGLTIVTHVSNAKFYEECMTRPHTLIPDTLARHPSPPSLKLVTVDDELVLEDKTMAIHLYRMTGIVHADNNLMIYFPRERLLTQADIFMPRDRRTSGHAPWVKELLQNIEARKLRIDRMMPLHGAIVPYKEFLQIVKDGFDRSIVSEPPPYRLADAG